MRSSPQDRSIIIKKADKDYCVVMRNRSEYISEAEKQLGDINIYKDVCLSDKVQQDVISEGNKLFKSLSR